jgi:hypothetical protein
MGEIKRMERGNQVDLGSFWIKNYRPEKKNHKLPTDNSLSMSWNVCRSLGYYYGRCRSCCVRLDLVYFFFFSLFLLHCLIRPRTPLSPITMTCHFLFKFLNDIEGRDVCGVSLSFSFSLCVCMFHFCFVSVWAIG